MFDKLKKIIPGKSEKSDHKNLKKLDEYEGEVKVNEADTKEFIEEIIKTKKNKKGDKMAERYGWYEKNGVKVYGKISSDKVEDKTIIKTEKEVNENVISIDEITKSNTTKTTSWWDSWRSNFQIAKRPTKTEDNTTLNVVFFKQQFLNKIMEKCLPKAGSSEFQFHYRALQIKVINPETHVRIVFTIPTIFFNFEQEVSGATVDYDLRKVSEISEQLKPISQQMAKVFIKQLSAVIKYFKEKGFDIKFVEEEIGSIHRHPGRFGFSSTDLDDNPLSPGVIYRNKKAVDLVQTDSVLYCDNDAELYTTETRVFNIKPVDENDEDKGVEGTVATAPTLCYILQDQENVNADPFASFFDEPVQENETKWLVHSYKDAKEYKEIKKLFKEFIKNYNPIDAVNPNNIKQKSYFYKYYDNYESYDDYIYGFSYKGGKSSKKYISKAKEEIAAELKFFEPIQQHDVEFAKEYLKDPETIATLKDIYEYYKNKKDKLNVDFKGGVQIRMNTFGGQLFYKGKLIWSWDWSEGDIVLSEDLYRGI